MDFREAIIYQGSLGACGSIHSPLNYRTVPVPCPEWSSQTANPSCFFLLPAPSPVETPCPKKKVTNTAYLTCTDQVFRSKDCAVEGQPQGQIRAEHHELEFGGKMCLFLILCKVHLVKTGFYCFYNVKYNCASRKYIKGENNIYPKP